LNRSIAIAFLLIVPFHGTTSAQAIGSGSIQLTSPLGYSLSQNFAVAYQNVAHTGQILGQGGVPCGGNTYTGYAVASGSLPTGLSINSVTGAITGTPTGTGASTFTVSFKDCSPPSGVTFTTPQVSITVATLNSITVTPTGQSIKTAQTLQLQASSAWSNGNTCPGASCSLDLSTLGTWACSGTGYSSISAAGLFTASGSAGTPSCTNSFNSVTSAADTITVGSSTPTIQTQATLCGGQINQAYPESGAPTCPGSVGTGAGVQLAASGGTAPYTWTLSSGSLPAGVTLGSTGLLSGVATASGSFSPVIQVCDSASNCTSKTFSLAIASITAVTVTPASPSVTSGTNQQFTATATYSDSTTAVLSNLGIPGGISFSQSNGAFSNVAASTLSIAFPGNTAAGNAIVVGAACSNTTISSVTDTQSNTYTQAVANGDSAIFYAQNIAGGADTVTVHFAASCNFSWLDPHEYAGLATTSMLDQETSATGTGTALNSGSVTTTQANELVFGYAFVQNALSQGGTGFTVRQPAPGVTTSNVMSEDEIVSATGTYAATFTQGTSGSWKALIATFKASGAGTQGWSSGTPAVASVDGNGLAATKSAGSSTITAAAGGTSGSATLTVTGGVTDTSLVLAPNPATGTVGGQLGLTATGNLTGNSYTAQAQWGSSNTAVATAGAGGVVTCVSASSTAVTITASSGNLSGTDSVTCQATSGTNLLPGCVVNGTTPSCSTPAGWTLETCQGFDSGSLAACTGGAHNSQSISSGTAINCTKGHTGSCSVATSINFNGATNQWYYGANQLPGHEVYLSEWDWGGGGAANEEYMLFHAVAAGSTFQEVLVDLVSHAGQYNDTCPQIVVYMQGSLNSNAYEQTVCYFAATWGQIETHFLANTPGSSNGILQMWLNGVQVLNLTNYNFNGSVDMTGMGVQAGGYYTKNVWTNNGQPPNSGGTCSSGIGEGSEVLTPSGWIGTFNASPLNAANCAPAPPTFTRYTDDIVVLGK